MAQQELVGKVKEQTLLTESCGDPWLLIFWKYTVHKRRNITYPTPRMNEFKHLKRVSAAAAIRTEHVLFIQILYL